MRIHLNESVWEVALDRIRYLFQEFPNVVVGFSGGKDSTVTLQLALIVAEEQGKLPVKVCFVDQEAEYQMTRRCSRRGSPMSQRVIWRASEQRKAQAAWVF